MKHYVVKVTLTASVLVMNAEHEDNAVQYAIDELSTGDCEIVDTEVGPAIEPGDESALEQAKIHASCISEA